MRKLMLYVVIVICFTTLVAADLTCDVNLACAGDVDLFYLNSVTGGHAATTASIDYPNTACCSSSTSTILTDCSGIYGVVLRLQAITNSHVEKSTELNYANDICLKSDDAGVTVDCDYVTGIQQCTALGGGYECVASISGDTNAQVGNCTAYNTITDSKACCTVMVCGDVYVDAGEECDDGNSLNTDSCLNNCNVATCGDGYVFNLDEECDDGNTVSGDGCANDCTIEYSDVCGNAKRTSTEACEDGNRNEYIDGCSRSCEYEDCSSNDLMAYWRLNEKDSTIVYDSTGNDNNGTLYGNTRLLMHFDDGVIEDKSLYNNYASITGTTAETECVSADCLYFDGSDDHIKLKPSNVLIPDNNSWAIEAWFNADTISSAITLDRILTFHRNVSTGTGLSILVGDNDKAIVRYYNTSQIDTYFEAGTITIDTWYHFVVTYDGTTFRSYLNNNEVAVTDGFYGIGSKEAYIGSYSGSGVPNFEGTIDEVAVYSKALTATEVESHYNLRRALYTDSVNGIPNGEGAVEFDGKDDYVDLGDVESLDGATEISISAWAIGEGNSIVRKWAPGGRSYMLTHFGTGIMFAVAESDGVYYRVNTSQGIVDVDNWNHVVGVWDGGASSHIYVNGVEQATSTYDVNDQSVSAIDDTAEHLIIGARHNFGIPDGFFNGTIDEVAIWNRSITQEEITRLYNNGSGRTACDDPIQGYRCEVYGVECRLDGIWKECKEMSYGENLTAMRARTRDIDNNVLNVTFALQNLHDYGSIADDDGWIVHTNTTSIINNVTGYWLLEFSDSPRMILDSGAYELTATCNDIGGSRCDYALPYVIPTDYTSYDPSTWVVPFAPYFIDRDADFYPDSYCHDFDDIWNITINQSTEGFNNTLTCNMQSTNCEADTKVGVISLGTIENSHTDVYNVTNYQNHICCAGDIDVYNVAGKCGEDGVVSISSNGNGHVNDYDPLNVYDMQVCISSKDNTTNVTCVEKNTACTAVDGTCMFTMSGSSNSHVGSCAGPYPRRVCCKIEAI